MLKKGADAYTDLFEKQFSRSKEESIKTKEEKPEEKAAPESNTPESETPKEVSKPKKTTPAKKPQENKKRKPGRPKNSEYGKGVRTPYSITMPRDTHDKIMEEAAKVRMSFAEFLEMAALDYMERMEKGKKN